MAEGTRRSGRVATPQPDECLHRIAVDEVTGPSPAASADGRADDESHLSVRPMEPDEIGRVVDYFHDADDEINVHQTVNRRQFGCGSDPPA